MAQLFHPSANTIAKGSIFATVFLAAMTGWVYWYIESSPSAQTKAASGAPSSAAEEDNSVDVNNGVSSALSSLASNWAKKAASKKMEEHQQAQAGKPLFSFTTELQGLSLDAIPESEFSIPVGFKKIVQKDRKPSPN